MKCYFNTDHLKEIQNGKEQLCENEVDGNTYCDFHKEKVWGEENQHRPKSLEAIQKRLKEMGKQSTAKFKTKKLGHMKLRDLLDYRLELKEWELTHPDDPRLPKCIEKRTAVETELRGRGIVSPDAGTS